jgi:MFS family permease
MIGYVLINGAGTISYFFPTLMKSLGYSGRNAQCELIWLQAALNGRNADHQSRKVMTVPIYSVALVISLTMGWNADRTNQKAWHIVAATIWGAASFIICATVKNYAVKSVPSIPIVSKQFD